MAIATGPFPTLMGLPAVPEMRSMARWSWVITTSSLSTPCDMFTELVSHAVAPPLAVSQLPANGAAVTSVRAGAMTLSSSHGQVL